jgi:hypothetical protein
MTGRSGASYLVRTLLRKLRCTKTSASYINCARVTQPWPPCATHRGGFYRRGFQAAAIVHRTSEFDR